jgi:hypothetical protein
VEVTYLELNDVRDTTAYEVAQGKKRFATSILLFDQVQENGALRWGKHAWSTRLGCLRRDSTSWIVP